MEEQIDLIQELQRHPNLDNIFAADVCNLISQLHAEQVAQIDNTRPDEAIIEEKHNILKALSISFANWWNDPGTQKDDRIKVLKDAAFNPFGKDNVETIDQDMKDKLNAMMAIMQPALRVDLQDYRYQIAGRRKVFIHYRRTTVDISLSDRLDDLLIESKNLWDNEHKPVHKDICQARHIGYSLVLVRLAILEPTVDNAKNITDYAEKISGKGTNVEFNQKWGRILGGIGLAILGIVVIGAIVAAMILEPMLIPVTGAPVNLFVGLILGGMALGGVTAGAGLYLDCKAQKSGLAYLTDRVGSSIFRDVKRANRPNMERPNGNGYHLLAGDNNGQGLNLRHRVARVFGQ